MQSKEIETSVQGYTNKGIGYAEWQDKKVAIRGALEGERVRATVYTKRKKHYIAELEEVVERSPSRIAATCRHAAECGGCAFQWLSYEAQCAHKQQCIKALFPEHTVAPVHPSRALWGYRNKMEYTFSEDRYGQKYLGLIKAGSRGRVMTLEECHLSPQWFVEALHEVLHWWQDERLKAYAMRRDEGHLLNLILRDGKKTGEKMATLVVSGRPEYAVPKKALARFVERLKARFGDISLFLRIRQAIQGMPTQFFEVHLSGREALHEQLDIRYPNGSSKTFHLTISPDAFFQPNTLQAEVIYETALALAQPKPDDLVCDLYCGSGTFGMVFAPWVRSVIGIESNPYAVHDAAANLAANGVDNMEVIRGDVGEKLPLIPRADLAIVDPPRAGLEPKALQHLLQLAPDRIVYISCNPRTQAANVAALIEAGYAIEAIQPIDQFPHTPHVENIMTLRRK